METTQIEPGYYWARYASRLNGGPYGDAFVVEVRKYKTTGDNLFVLETGNEEDALLREYVLGSKITCTDWSE